MSIEMGLRFRGRPIPRVLRAGCRGTLAGLVAVGALAGCGGGDDVDSDAVAEATPPVTEPRAGASASAGTAGTARVSQAGSGAPSIASVRITPSRPEAGEMVLALVDASDPDGDEISLGYTWSLGSQRLRGGGSEIEIPATGQPGQELSVSVVASDGKHNSEISIASVSLENRAPRIESLSFENSNASPGDTLELIVEANDPDGQPLEREIQWYVNGHWTEATGESFETTELDRGDRVHAEVRVGDGDDFSPRVASEKVTIGNTAPKVVSSPGGLDDDGTFRYAIEATDPDGDRSFRYSLAEAPAGMRLDPVGGEVVWTPTPDDAGVHWIELVVADRHGGEARQRFDLTIRVGSGGDEDAPQTGGVAAPRP